MRAKGYNVETISHHEKLLNEYINDYGFNIKQKSVPDIFRTNIKAKASVNHSGLIKKNK